MTVKKAINFTAYNKLFLSISLAAVFILSITVLVRGGFNFSIDFSSGVIFTVTADESVEVRNIEEQVAPLFDKAVQVQSLVDSALFGAKRYSLKLVSELDNIAEFEKQAAEKISQLEFLTIEGSDLVSPVQSSYLRWNTWFLSLFVLLLILLYIWYRFQLRYAIAAIVALIHDSLILLGFIGAFQLDFSSTTVAAILTVIGYSLNDTIVVFDRIRENRMTMHTSNLQNIINFSLTATLSRTLITSLTTLLAVLAIYFFAYGSVQLFALKLIVGVTVGTYSSIYIASSLVLFFDTRQRKGAAEAVNAHSHELRSKLPTATLQVVKKLEPVLIHKPQTAEEIRLATEAKRKKREARRKKK